MNRIFVCGTGAGVLSLMFLILLTSSCSQEERERGSAGYCVNIIKEGFFRNERRYVKDNINIFCRPIKKGRNYNFLIMGSPAKPYAGHPPVLAKFPDGSIVNLGEVTPKRLHDIAWSIKDVSGESCAEIAAADFVKEHEVWPAETFRIQFNYWLFFVQNDRVLSIFAWTYGEGEEKPAFGTPNMNHLHELPLTEHQVIDIFGRPDVIREYLTE